MIAIAVMISAGGVAGLEIEKFFAHMSYIELLYLPDFALSFVTT